MLCGVGKVLECVVWCLHVFCGVGMCFVFVSTCVRVFECVLACEGHICA